MTRILQTVEAVQLSPGRTAPEAVLFCTRRAPGDREMAEIRRLVPAEEREKRIR